MNARPQRTSAAVELIAIYLDQEQILIDQASSTISVPPISIPVPFTASDQTALERLTALIKSQYDINGAIATILPVKYPEIGDGLAVVIMTSDAATTAALDRRGLRWRDIRALQTVLDEETSLRVQAALNAVKAHQLADDLKEVWSSKLPRAVSFLQERMVESDGAAGWTQFLTGGNIGVLSTAQGALAFLEGSPGDHDITRNVGVLRASQNDDGGWPVRRALIGQSNRSITESTIYCLWALTRAGADVQEPEMVRRGIEWLERAQHHDGGWGSTTDPPRARTYPTTFAVRFLATTTGMTSAVRNGVSWLRTAQNPDGGWAPLASSEINGHQSSTPAHTAHALLALNAASTPSADPKVSHAVRYLMASVNTTNGEPWPSTSEVETVDENAALDFRHFATPWVLCALLKAEVPIGEPLVMNAIQWILREQHSLGYWSSPLTPGQTPIWATFDAIHALVQVRQAALDRFAELVRADSRFTELNLAWASYFSLLDSVNLPSIGDRLYLNRWIYAWNSALTFFVVLIILFDDGSISHHLSPLTKIIGSALIGLIPGFAPFLYQVVLEELKIKLKRGKDD